MDKRVARQRRARRVRVKIRELGSYRLCVYRTPRHTYAQIISPGADRTLAAASTLEKEVSGGLRHGGNIEAAQVIGRMIAERAQAAGVNAVAFDRSGFKFHGRVKALAEAAREAGLKF